MSRFLGLLSILIFAIPARAELPLATSASWNDLRQQCQPLAGNRSKALPLETAKALRALLDRKPAEDEDAVREVQKLLDPHCLIGVTINPESRVKAARGPADVSLVKDRATLVLVKVHNEAGVTHPLAVSGPQILGKNAVGEGRWLEVAVLGKPSRLLGQRLEYVVLKLTAREVGKREATLKFDVGQGSQDLGFRGEVPILFTVREP